MNDDELLHALRNSKGWPTLGKAAADRIEELKEEIKMHEECATIVHFQGVRYAHENMADNIWAAFKDKWEGERKYALRQIVQWLRADRAGRD